MDNHVARWPQQTASGASARDAERRSKIDLSRLSDSELMVRLKEGEHEALSQLFDRYHKLTLSIATKIIRDSGEAEDVMQEVFLAIFRVVERFDPTRGTFKNWIVQFTYHKSLNRRKYLLLRPSFDDPQIREFEPPEISYSPQGRNGHTEDEALTIVREGMTTLTPNQREVVELACFEGYLFREIADRTNQSLGNVRHHYYRAINKLRDFVKVKLHPEEKERAAVPGGER
jgi:RNA polymerase sigma-70 factor (ECF subfamily)